MSSTFKLRFAPGDNASNYSPVILTNPDTWQPNPKEYGLDGSNPYHAWGLYTKSYVEKQQNTEGGEAPSTMKSSMLQGLYVGSDTPVEQWLKRRAARVEDELVRARISPGFQANRLKWFKLKVWLTEIDSNRLCRVFWVPAASTLEYFVNRVLIAGFGWTPGLHGWVVENPRDGSCFGPDARSGYNDFIHLRMRYGGYVIPASNYQVCDLVQREGDHFAVMYDLSALFAHTVQLEASSDQPHKTMHMYNTAPVELVAAVGACPPESCGMGSTRYAEWLAKYDKTPTKRKLTQQMIGQNVEEGGFDPDRVNISVLRAIMVEMCLTPPRPPFVGGNEILYPPPSPSMIKTCLRCSNIRPQFRCGGCKMATYCSEPCRQAHWRTQHKFDCATWMNHGKQIEDGSSLPPSVSVTTTVMTTTITTTNSNTEGCQKCGTTTVPLMLCKGCRKVRYCGMQCQRDDWMLHKSACHNTDNGNG